jgi:uncharacterized protein (TIGR04255 family)
MDKPLASFRAPPITETAISVQFKPLRQMSNGHLGLFWERVRDAFPISSDAVPIEPKVERFGPDIQRVRLPHLRVGMAPAASRLRMESPDQHSMLQIQNGRLVFNWMRLADGEYPRWAVVRPRFDSALRELESLVADEKLGAIEPDQWEVVYVNQFLKGREWTTPSDWNAILPGVIGTTSGVPDASLETGVFRASFEMPKRVGRIHVEVSHGFSGPDDEATEVLVVQLTARGSVDKERGPLAGLDIGREAIVRTFVALTGEHVRKVIWQQEEAEK